MALGLAGQQDLPHLGGQQPERVARLGDVLGLEQHGPLGQLQQDRQSGTQGRGADLRRGAHVDRLGKFGDLAAEALQGLQHHPLGGAHEDLTLGLEVAVEGALGDVGARAQVGDAHLAVAVQAERLDGHVEDPLGHDGLLGTAAELRCLQERAVAVGEDLRQDLGDLRQREALALPEAADHAQRVDVLGAVQEALGRDPGGRRQQTPPHIVMHRGCRYAGPVHQLRHREAVRALSVHLFPRR